MRFTKPLVRGRFLRRYKRFFADVCLDDGREVVAHCANPGSMKSLLVEGATVWLSQNSDPKRKLRFTWELLGLPEGMVYVNPARANDVVFDALKRQRISELAPYDVIKREVAFGESSRIDFQLTGGPLQRCLLEVKNVTLTLGSGKSAFPDSVTVRGTKHLRELMAAKRAGWRAILFFCVGRADAVSVEPADAIDPTYGQTLREAVESGVEVLAYRCQISDAEVALSEPVPVLL